MATDEWYTPDYVLEPIWDCLGYVDLDPCSNDIAQQRVLAGRYWTKDDDMFSKSPEEWMCDAVFMNPPYTAKAGTAGPYVARFVDMYELGCFKEGILVLNASINQKWWKPLRPFPHAIPFERIKFVDADGNPGTSPRYNNVIVFVGPEMAWPRFARHFRHFCTVYAPI